MVKRAPVTIVICPGATADDGHGIATTMDVLHSGCAALINWTVAMQRRITNCKPTRISAIERRLQKQYTLLVC
jgi:hypothetical protein